MSVSPLARLLFRLSAHLPCRVINGPDGEPYLERYHLLRLPFGVHLYLHRFVASDPGRSLHDHPWRHALGVMLSGGYEEVRMRGAGQNNRLQQRFLAGGRINYISGATFHRINLPQGGEAWTLFIHSGKRKNWGFIDTTDQQHFMPHQQVVEARQHFQWWKSAPKACLNPAMRKAQSSL